MAKKDLVPVNVIPIKGIPADYFNIYSIIKVAYLVFTIFNCS